MNLSRLKLVAAITGQLARTRPRVGGRQPMGLRVERALSAPVAWSAEVDLQAVGDNAYIIGTSGELDALLAMDRLAVAGAGGVLDPFLVRDESNDEKPNYSSTGLSSPSTGTTLVWYPVAGKWIAQRTVGGVVVYRSESTSDTDPDNATGWVTTIGVNAPSFTYVPHAGVYRGSTAGLGPEGTGPTPLLGSISDLLITATNRLGHAVPMYVELPAGAGFADGFSGLTTSTFLVSGADISGTLFVRAVAPFSTIQLFASGPAAV